MYMYVGGSGGQDQVFGRDNCSLELFRPDFYSAEGHCVLHVIYLFNYVCMHAFGRCVIIIGKEVNEA